MNGIGLYWSADGDLYLGTYKDDKSNGQYIFHFYSGEIAYNEYQDGLSEGI
jgi:hypothetical protein